MGEKAKYTIPASDATELYGGSLKDMRCEGDGLKRRSYMSWTCVASGRTLASARVVLTENNR